MLRLPLVIVAVGTVAYPLIEGPKWTLFDGLYMTVITLTTLGYGEIPEPLSKVGRTFTMLLALGGIFVLFYIATEIIRTVVTGELRDLLGEEHMDDELRHLNGHFIVCGCGRMGRIVCDELDRLNRKFVAIDVKGPDGPWNFSNGLFLKGDAAEDEILRRAGIDRARALITALGTDAQNLYITLSARLLNPNLFIVARAEEEAAEPKLRKVGASTVVSPYLTGGHRAVQAVLKPSVLQFMDMAARPEFADLQMEEFKVAPGSQLAGQTLGVCNLSQEFGISVIAIVLPTGQVLHAPPGEVVIEPGSVLIVIGPRSKLEPAELLTAGRRGEKN
jgi:voltage-gated potassium channel